MSMKQYMIRDKVQQPVRVNLIDPATGKQTEDWLDIRSSLSDEFTVAREDVQQRVGTITEPSKEKRLALVKELQLDLKVALVAGWSFEEAFNEDTVREFLRNAPQIQNMVMSVADDTASFFGPRSVNSDAGRKKK